MKLKTFQRGVHPSYHKGLTQASGIEKAELPKSVVIPLQQHIGAPCAPLVKKGDEVIEGQRIGEAGAFVTAPVHASISGKVKEVALKPFPGGGKVLSVVIEGDGGERNWEEEKGEFREFESLKPEEVRRAIKDAGIVGMGGAAFPTAVKLSPPGDKKLDSVVLNGCECEPYLTCDHRVMLEEPDKVIWGLRAIMKTVGASSGYIGIEDNKRDAIEALRASIERISPGIKVVPLETKYPQGAEKMLIHAVLKRKVPTGKLPLEVGVVVNNTSTAVAI
ncbi:MAG: RnfABCDGE type electron transport complex subunit C, partial [Deltaproteobacteria bacterium]|nr:RnfABCDGE type electron transport complex subunit C [Deltaproteobacteria bacterium]